MIEQKIPQELDSYEAKFVGNFTLRQTVCIFFMAVSAYFIYSALSPYLGRDLTGFVMFIPSGIAVAFGWLKPYGMKLEKFLQSAFVNNVLAPQKRPYQTENTFDVLMKAKLPVESIEKSDEIKETNHKSSRKILKKNTMRKKKYKVSKRAIK